MILVFGTVCVDRIRRIEKLPRPGGYAEVTEQREILGGEAANTACHLTMWRDDVVLAGNSLGAGFEGERLRLLVLEKGLSDQYLARQGATPVCDVYVSADGDRTMFGSGFSAMAPGIDLDMLPWEVGGWFTSEPNMSEISREAVKGAFAHGMKLYLMDFFRPDEFLPAGSICQYSTDWVGTRGSGEENLAWVSEWSTRHRVFTILTDGGNGLFVSLPDGESTWLPTVPAPNVVDSTGAGDAFRAGVLHGLHRGRTLGESLLIGSAAGSLSVGQVGATEGIPTMSEVHAHMSAYPSVAEQYHRIVAHV